MKKQNLTICVVDDEQKILNLLKNFLAGRKGADVHTFSKPVNALSFLNNGGRSCDILITDFNMPILTGIDLFNYAKEISPAIKTVCISGIPQHEDECIDVGFDVFLEKPLVLEKLWREICRLV
ncbi:MAG TPA: response regulator [Candidatus Moranbacteria bacterium]|nr:response regulator [Candidatus Moranbacteria bacterium]